MFMVVMQTVMVVSACVVMIIWLVSLCAQYLVAVKTARACVCVGARGGG